MGVLLQSMSGSPASAARSKLRLIGAVPQVGGRLAGNYTTPQKPFRALFHMVCIRIRGRCAERGFLCALTLCDGQRGNKQEWRQGTANHATEAGKLHRCQLSGVWECRRAWSKQKAHKSDWRSILANRNVLKPARHKLERRIFGACPAACSIWPVQSPTDSYV